MIATRKICKNIVDIEEAKEYNRQSRYDFETNRSVTQYEVEVPEPIYQDVEFSFRPSMVDDWYRDNNGDLIIWLRNRGETRFVYSPLLETKLDAIFSTDH